MNEKKIYTLKIMKEGLETCLQSIPYARINLHDRKSLSNDTVFSTIILPIDKALKIFGDIEILYPQIFVEGSGLPYVKFGIVIED